MKQQVVTFSILFFCGYDYQGWIALREIRKGFGGGNGAVGAFIMVSRLFRVEIPTRFPTILWSIVILLVL
ncbi:hypothetical protein TSUD_207540 [Trifolium subterraneum]|uniref:Uncharacterized protein n=1 Tax=Trifolium subterraneum TaxID=3900 RepID=A0A2Z6MWW4_TRISU|nr:hypothetical protein TSUD_207540 [Trifolium subterraneum]